MPFVGYAEGNSHSVHVHIFLKKSFEKVEPGNCLTMNRFVLCGSAVSLVV